MTCSRWFGTVGRAPAVVILVGAAAACGPAWTVVKQAAPDPIVGVRTFTIEPARYPAEGQRVGDQNEREWLAGRTPDQVRAFQADKVETETAFATRLTANPLGYTFLPPTPAGSTTAGATFVLRPVFTFLERGIFTGIFSIPTTLKMIVQLLDGGGAVLDEVEFSATVSADSFHPETGGRMRDCGGDLGAQLLKYVQARTGLIGK